MNYFKFTIEPGLKYSPGWHGTLDHCPSDVTVLLYNNKEGYGIAQTPDTITQKELTPLTVKQKNEEMTKVVAEPGVYFGDTLNDVFAEEVPGG
uniref:Uncharacterized protein n=1 Tax=viral metagenome TaxID=1070528 RepID=A0A6M3JSG9_9ZZZZ